MYFDFCVPRSGRTSNEVRHCHLHTCGFSKIDMSKKRHIVESSWNLDTSILTTFATDYILGWLSASTCFFDTRGFLSQISARSHVSCFLFALTERWFTRWWRIWVIIIANIPEKESPLLRQSYTSLFRSFGEICEGMMHKKNRTSIGGRTPNGSWSATWYEPG